ncbi:hypothetical protein DFH09DRAFT_1427218 [Mycena vulgaris]|nr:hypothetical protein DFH09DRAFT_1427218 [Mycena vulgaris]
MHTPAPRLPTQSQQLTDQLSTLNRHSTFLHLGFQLPHSAVVSRQRDIAAIANEFDQGLALHTICEREAIEAGWLANRTNPQPYELRHIEHTLHLRRALRALAYRASATPVEHARIIDQLRSDLRGIPFPHSALDVFLDELGVSDVDPEGEALACRVLEELSNTRIGRTFTGELRRKPPEATRDQAAEVIRTQPLFLLFSCHHIFASRTRTHGGTPSAGCREVNVPDLLSSSHHPPLTFIYHRPGLIDPAASAVSFKRDGSEAIRMNTSKSHSYASSFSLPLITLSRVLLPATFGETAPSYPGASCYEDLIHCGLNHFYAPKCEAAGDEMDCLDIVPAQNMSPGCLNPDNEPHSDGEIPELRQIEITGAVFHRDAEPLNVGGVDDMVLIDRTGPDVLYSSGTHRNLNAAATDAQ